MKKLFLLLAVLVFALMCSCVSAVAAPTNEVKVNLTLGEGETVSIAKYLKDSNQVVWSTQNKTIAAVTGTNILGGKKGTTTVTGKSDLYLYTFKVKVFERSGIVAAKSTDSTITNNAPTDPYYAYNGTSITVGLGNKIDFSGILPVSYDNYLWRTIIGSKNVSYSRGTIKGLKEGISVIMLTGNTSKNKNNIIRLIVKVDSNVESKYIKLARNKKVDLNTYLTDCKDYAISVESKQGSAVAVEENFMTSPNASGTCLVYADSITGGKNKVFVVETV